MKNSKTNKLERLRNLNWESVQVAGTLFTDALEQDTLHPTQEQLADLVMLTAKLLEFVSEAREIVHDYDDVALVS